MKLAAATLSITTCLSLFIQAQETGGTQASKSAISYLKKLSDGKLELTDNTALSSYCDINRRKEITNQLEFYRKTSLPQGDKYLLEEQKTLGALAAVIVRAENPVTPLNTRMHTIAMVKRNGAWLPAPLPGSFSNTAYGYDLEVEKSAQNLVQWMAKQKTKRETNARKKATEKLIASISAQEQKLDLKNTSPEKTALKLIEALRSRDIKQALAVMGAASGELDTPLEVSVDSVSKGLMIIELDNEWSLVKRRSVYVQVMNLDNRRKEVAIGFWDPLAKTSEKILYFPFYEFEGKTFVKLPKLLEVALLSKSDRLQQRWKHRRSDQTTLRKKLPAEIFKNSQAKLYTNKQKLLTAILESHKKGAFSELVHLLPHEGDFFGSEENQKKSLEDISLLWKDLTGMRRNPMQILDTLEKENIALTPLQFAKTNWTGEITTIQIWMIKLENSWHLVPKNLLSEYGGAETNRTMQKLIKSVQSNQKAQQEKLSRKLIDSVTVLTPPLELNAPAEADAKKLLTTFLSALRTKDIASTLKHCAVLKGTSSKQTLKISNYAMRGVADQSAESEMLGYHQSGKWSALSIKTHSKSSDIEEYPLYLIVNTVKGSKVLLDIDLRHATNKGRELLNTRAWKKLAEVLPENSLTEVKVLFKKHTKLSSEDIAKNNPEDED